MSVAVITGASGMLGQALIRQLLKRNDKIYAIVRPASEYNANIVQTPNVCVIECDLKELSNLPKNIEETCDVFYHFGWGGTFGNTRNNLYGQLDNVKYTLDAVKVAHELGCKVFLGAGSQAEFGRVSDHVKLSAKVLANPETGYGIAKLAAGQMSRALCKEYGIKHVWTRILSIYGPMDKARSMVMSGIYSMLQGERPHYTKGEQMWDYLYCDDAANAFISAAEKGEDGAIYCIGSGQAMPLRDYICKIRDVIDPDLELVFGEIPYYDKQVMYLCADISDLTKDTGFVPKIAFEEGIRKTVEWCRGEINAET